MERYYFHLRKLKNPMWHPSDHGGARNFKFVGLQKKMIIQNLQEILEMDCTVGYAKMSIQLKNNYGISISKVKN